MSASPASQQARFFHTSRDALANGQLRALLQDVTARFAANRAASLEDVPDLEALREQARLVRARTLAALDRYLVEFETQIVARGGAVHWASTPEDACRLVLDIAARHGARRVVKSKSMVTEEVGLNDRLSEAGLVPLETDFGEYIIQLAGERPSHIIAPAIHKSRHDVGRLFAEKLGVPFTSDVEALAREARRRLRAEFCAADIGVSGANFAVAETGTIVIVENEGNARLCSSVPRVHIVVTGIEKMIPSTADLPVFLTLLPRSATGQPMTSYVSFISGPRRSGELDGPDELHVVLLDNGRTRVLADPALRESLQCIRCGACLNVCPVYRHIGGHAYGAVYAGPIGALVSPHLDAGHASPGLPFVSTLCGACASVCPVKIRIPEVLLHLRHEVTRGALPVEPLAGRRTQQALMWLYSAVVRSPARYRGAAWLVRHLARPGRRQRWLRSLPGLQAWTEGRDLPVPAARSFRQLWAVRYAASRRHAPR